MAFLRSEVQCCRAALLQSVHVGVVLDEEAYQLLVAFNRRHVKWRGTSLVKAIDADLVRAEQYFRDATMAIEGRLVQWRRPVLSVAVDGGSTLKQQLDKLEVTVARRKVQRCTVVIVDLVDIRPTLDEKRCYSSPILPRSDLERRELSGIQRIDVRMGVQEKSGNALMISLRCQVQRIGAFLLSGLDVHLEPQKHPHNGLGVVEASQVNGLSGELVPRLHLRTRCLEQNDHLVMVVLGGVMKWCLSGVVDKGHPSSAFEELLDEVDVARSAGDVQRRFARVGGGQEKLVVVAEEIEHRDDVAVRSRRRSHPAQEVGVKRGCRAILHRRGNPQGRCPPLFEAL
eukprot:scaffold2394_cov276-Pinguiococcus_pyrenoidosus.AAC.2